MSEFFELPVEEEIPYEEVEEIIPFEETPEETGVDLVLDFTAKLIPYAEKVITVSEESDSETTEEYQDLLDQIKVLKEQLESVQLGLSGTYETSETFNDLMAKGAELNWEMTRSLESASLEIGNLEQLAEDLREDVDLATGYANSAVETANDALEQVGEAVASANGKNTRNTSTASPLGPPIATVNLNGRPLIEGDTWWKVSSMVTRIVKGQWQWDGTAWIPESFGTEVIANLDVSKLTAGIASMDILAAKKMAVDFGTFKVLTTDKLAVISTDGGVYPDPMFLDPGLGALRALNTADLTYSEGTGSFSGTGNMWLTRDATDEGKTIPLVKGERYSIRVWGTGLTLANGRKFAVRDDAGYAIVDASYFTGGMSVLLQPGSDNARVQIWRTGTSGTATHTISRVEIRHGIGGILLEDGAVTADKVYAGAIGTPQLAANAVTAEKVAIGDLSNMTTLNAALPGSVTYSGWKDTVVTGYGGDKWSTRTPLVSGASITSAYFMFRPSTGPVPLVAGDRVRLTFEGYASTGSGAFDARVWGYDGSGGNINFGLYATATSPVASLSATPQKFIMEGVVPAGFENSQTYIIGLSASNFGNGTLVPLVRNTRAYRMGAGELIVDGSISGDKVTGGTMIGTTIISPGDDDGDSLTIENQTMTVRRAPDGGDGDPIITTSLGGSDSDRLILANGLGRTGVSFDGGTGSGALAGTLSVNDLTIGGDTFDSYMSAMPLGVVTFGELTADTPYAGTSALGLAMLWFPMKSSRMYRARMSGMLAAGTAGDVAQLSWQWFSPSAGTAGIGNFPRVSSTADHVDYSVVFKGHGTGPRRLGAMYKNATANRPIFWSGRSDYPVQVSIEDLGLANYNGNDAYAEFTIMGGTPLSGGGSLPPTPASTYVKTYSPSWTRSWRGSTQVTDYLQHGYYGGYQRYSAAGFNTDADMVGATVTKAELRLTNASWWGSSGTARIGTSTITSAPTSPITSGSTTNVTGWPQGAQKWVTIPWTSAQRAITLGVGAGSGTDGYGKFKNNDVELRLTYTK